MNRSVFDIYRRQRWNGIALLLLMFAMPVMAASNVASVPKAGGYCPGSDILRISAEDISAALELVMRSRAALVNNDRVTAINALASAGTALQLAASRGAAARTILLIDAIVQAKAAKNYAQMLTWFPLLHSSLQTLPDDATVRETDDLIARAEDGMQRIDNANPLQYLKEARHMLACDGLDIPLHNARRAQASLLKKLGQLRVTSNAESYDDLLDSIRNTLAYSLERNGAV